jgi:syndecan 1
MPVLSPELPLIRPPDSEDRITDPVRELSSRVFSSLTRFDHRVKAEQYLRGLLTARGRKSMRGVALSIDGPAAAQRLHHFIHNAPWDWHAVRRGLARYLVDQAQPGAWVVRPILIPKTGDKSPGVHRRYAAATGRVVRGQQAYGLWSSTSINTPVDWYLHMPDRDRHTVPREAPPRQVTEGLRLLKGPMPTRAPVLWDSPTDDPADVLRAFPAGWAPLAVRLLASAPLVPRGPGGARARVGRVPAERVFDAIPRSWSTEVQVAPGVRVVTARVALPGPGSQSGEELVLYAELGDGGLGPGQFWLASTGKSSAAELHCLIRSTTLAARRSMTTCARAGLCDFAGRSFEGWHRHATLASAAHAYLVLHDGGPGRGSAPPSGSVPPSG